MELQAFIKTTLLEIMGGIRDAQKEWSETTDNNGVINPAWDKASEDHTKTVNFDVAVTAETSAQTDAGAGIKVWGVGLGGSVSDTDRNSSVSRIQFEVPIIPPVIVVRDEPGRPLDLSKVGSAV